MNKKELLKKISAFPNNAEICFNLGGETENFYPNSVFFDKKDEEIVFLKVPEMPIF